MSSTLVEFTPSTLAPFQFQPTMAGTQYTVIVTWNIFGQRFYINLFDLGGTLILCRAMSPSGPSLLATFVWAGNTAYAATQDPHNVPIGAMVTVDVTQSGSLFDTGDPVIALSTGPNGLTYPLTTNPMADNTTGTVNFSLNLVQGYIDNGVLLFHEDTQQFEYT